VKCYKRETKPENKGFLFHKTTALKYYFDVVFDVNNENRFARSMDFHIKIFRFAVFDVNLM